MKILSRVSVSSKQPVQVAHVALAKFRDGSRAGKGRVCLPTIVLLFIRKIANRFAAKCERSWTRSRQTSKKQSIGFHLKREQRAMLRLDLIDDRGIGQDG